MLLLLALPLVPWILYSIFIITTQQARRVIQGVKVAIWVSAVFVVIGIHYYLYVSTQASANKVASAIQQYAKEHGSYPPNIDAIGMSKGQLRSELGLSAYILESGKPTLFYATTYLPFQTEHYDFETNHWRHVGD